MPAMAAIAAMPQAAIKKHDTIDVALRIKNYLPGIMSKAKRLRLITVNPSPALPLLPLPELQARIDAYKGRAFTASR